jgi:hypothetical protein
MVRDNYSFTREGLIQSTQSQAYAACDLATSTGRKLPIAIEYQA